MPIVLNPPNVNASLIVTPTGEVPLITQVTVLGVPLMVMVHPVTLLDPEGRVTSVGKVTVIMPF